MRDALFKSLSLLDASGYLIIVAILALLVAGVACTLFIYGRYVALEQELQGPGQDEAPFRTAVLNHVVRAAVDAQIRHAGEVNTQAIIEQHFQSELRRLLLGERFIRSVTGLLIILGLVGTFYGLTLSIGKLVSLVSGDAIAAADVADSLMKGLSQALSGMSVAFVTSLFGISAAIVMTLLGVFYNVSDRRTAVMVQLEHYLDNVLLATKRGARAEAANMGSTGEYAGGMSDGRLERAVAGFGQSVSRLEGVVSEFQKALHGFSTSTREFGELNLHLKDNIQRMSLSFADLSNTLKDQVDTLRSRERK